MICVHYFQALYIAKCLLVSNLQGGSSTSLTSLRCRNGMFFLRSSFAACACELLWDLWVQVLGRGVQWSSLHSLDPGKISLLPESSAGLAQDHCCVSPENMRAAIWHLPHSTFLLLHEVKWCSLLDMHNMQAAYSHQLRANSSCLIDCMH